MKFSDFLKTSKNKLKNILDLNQISNNNIGDIFLMNPENYKKWIFLKYLRFNTKTSEYEFKDVNNKIYKFENPKNLLHFSDGDLVRYNWIYDKIMKFVPKSDLQIIDTNTGERFTIKKGTKFEDTRIKVYNIFDRIEYLDISELWNFI